MNLEEELNQRLHMRDIDRLCRELDTDEGTTQLLRLVFGGNDRVTTNALWMFTHLSAQGRRRLGPHRRELIDFLLVSNHQSHKRLILNLLERMSWTKANIETDLLDYCLSNINSTEPYAIRAFCLRLAFLQCRHYPALLDELHHNIDLMSRSELPPGLKCARKNILAQIARLSAQAPAET